MTYKSSLEYTINDSTTDQNFKDFQRKAGRVTRANGDLIKIAAEIGKYSSALDVTSDDITALENALAEIKTAENILSGRA